MKSKKNGFVAAGYCLRNPLRLNGATRRAGPLLETPNRIKLSVLISNPECRMLKLKLRPSIFEIHYSTFEIGMFVLNLIAFWRPSWGGMIIGKKGWPF